MNKKQVCVADWMQLGLELYKENWFTLILAGFLVAVLSSVTFGILAGPMCAGMIYLVLRMLSPHESAPRVGDVFRGFDYFLHSFLYTLVFSVIFAVLGLVVWQAPFVGRILFVLVQVAGWTLVSFALFLIVDKKMSFLDAAKVSFQLVLPNFFPILGLLLIAGILSSIGILFCVVGIVVTAPIQICIMTIAYKELFRS